MTAALNVIAINNTITLLRRSPERFDMGTYGFVAGRDWDGGDIIGGCLARFVLEANGYKPEHPLEFDNALALHRAMAVLGLSNPQANALFTNYNGLAEQPACPLPYERVRPAHGIAVLEILRDTGQVQWTPAIHKVMRETWGHHLDHARVALAMLMAPFAALRERRQRSVTQQLA